VTCIVLKNKKEKQKEEEMTPVFQKKKLDPCCETLRGGLVHRKQK
jgi:hypothetical protein